MSHGTQKTACTAELSRYPLFKDIEASLCVVGKDKNKNRTTSLNRSFYKKTESVFYFIKQWRNNKNALQKRGNKSAMRDTRPSIKQQLQKNISQDWFKAQTNITEQRL